MRNELYIHDLVRDCSNSSTLAMELLQSCTKPLIYKSDYEFPMDTQCLLYVEEKWETIDLQNQQLLF